MIANVTRLTNRPTIRLSVRVVHRGRQTRQLPPIAAIFGSDSHPFPYCFYFGTAEGLR
jgi:hypothetical protein